MVAQMHLAQTSSHAVLPVQWLLKRKVACHLAGAVLTGRMLLSLLQDVAKKAGVPAFDFVKSE